MLDVMLHQMVTLLMAGIGFGASPMAAPSPELACPTSLTVSATISNGNIVPKADANNGSSCTTFPCNFTAKAGSVISVSYNDNSGQFIYEYVTSSPLWPSATSITVPQSGSASIGFSIVGANGNQAIVLDPKITVTAGTCTTSI
jgi:hypothetical protein